MLKLYSSDLRPFAHRARLVVSAKAHRPQTQPAAQAQALAAGRLHPAGGA